MSNEKILNYTLENEISPEGKIGTLQMTPEFKKLFIENSQTLPLVINFESLKEDETEAEEKNKNQPKNQTQYQWQYVRELKGNENECVFRKQIQKTSSGNQEERFETIELIKKEEGDKFELFINRLPPQSRNLEYVARELDRYETALRNILPKEQSISLLDENQASDADTAPEKSFTMIDDDIFRLEIKKYSPVFLNPNCELYFIDYVINSLKQRKKTIEASIPKKEFAPAVAEENSSAKFFEYNFYSTPPTGLAAYEVGKLKKNESLKVIFEDIKAMKTIKSKDILSFNVGFGSPDEFYITHIPSQNYLVLIDEGEDFALRAPYNNALRYAAIELQRDGYKKHVETILNDFEKVLVEYNNIDNRNTLPLVSVGSSSSSFFSSTRLTASSITEITKVGKEFMLGRIHPNVDNKKEWIMGNVSDNSILSQYLSSISTHLENDKNKQITLKICPDGKLFQVWYALDKKDGKKVYSFHEIVSDANRDNKPKGFRLREGNGFYDIEVNRGITEAPEYKNFEQRKEFLERIIPEFEEALKECFSLVGQTNKMTVKI